MGFVDWLLGRSPPGLDDVGEVRTIGSPWTPGPGWRPYFYALGGLDPEVARRPDAEVEVIREGWDAPILAKDLSPHSNVVGLWWRPVGPMIDVTPSPAERLSPPSTGGPQGSAA